MMSVR